MDWGAFFPYLLVMAGVTYLVRMVPMTFFRRQIRSRFVKSFLHYVPYAVLTAMTVPGVLYSTGYVSGEGRQQLSEDALAKLQEAYDKLKAGEIDPAPGADGTLTPDDFPGLN